MAKIERDARGNLVRVEKQTDGQVRAVRAVRAGVQDEAGRGLRKVQGQMTTHLPKTRAAIEAYDAGEAKRAYKIIDAETEEHMGAAMAEEEAAVQLVREAFAEDTRGINPRDKAMLVHPDERWLRDACGVEPRDRRPPREGVLG